MKRTIKPKCLYILVVFLIFSSCSRLSFDTIEDYQKWLVSDQSTLRATSESNQITFELLHIPNVLMQALNRNIDSNQHLAFQFRIKSNSNQDILSYNLEDKEKYDQRVSLLEYRMSEFFKIEHDPNIKPSLVHYENYRGLKNEILIHLHYEKFELQNEYLVIVYNDELLNTGKQRFVYKTSHIRTPPKLKQQNS